MVVWERGGGIGEEGKKVGKKKIGVYIYPLPQMEVVLIVEREEKER